MKLMRWLFKFSGVICLGLVPASCDWTSGGDGGFNTSGGGASVNISGAYQGIISGRAVSNTSGAPIASFTIQQSGNVVEVRDSNGSNYRGTVGSPNTLVSGSSGSVGAGQSLASFQISWAGRDGVAQKDVQFTGVITVISVSDIQGRTRNTSDGRTSDSTTTRTDASTVTTEQGFDDTQTDDATGQSEIDSSVTSSTTTTGGSNTGGSTGSDTRTSTTTFTLTRGNSQNNLRGTWVEAGGVSANVDAIAQTAGGTVTTTTTTQ